MTTYRSQLEAVVQALEFHSSSCFAWLGVKSDSLPADLARGLSADTLRHHVLETIANHLYANFYVSGGVVPVEQRAESPNPDHWSSLTEVLSAANTGVGWWQEGWRVLRVLDRRVAVQNGTFEMSVRLEDCLRCETQLPVEGSRIAVRMPKEMPSFWPGFYLAQSDQPFVSNTHELIVRVYWNLNPPAAEPLVGALTTSLNNARVRFQIKVLHDPSRFTRCDAAVLYIHKGDFSVFAELLGAMYGTVAAHLKPDSPALTKALLPGVAVAEDPATGESFGQHRCRLIAEGLMRAYELRRETVSSRLATIVDYLRNAGVNLQTPYLNTGSIDTYVLPAQAWRSSLSRRPGVCISRTTVHREDILVHPAALGRRLAETAIWFRGQCTWIGQVTADTHQNLAAPGVVGQALGPDVYAGTSGIALFLAQLYTATGDESARRTARGALTHALARLDPEVGIVGLYAGWSAIALVAARISVLLNEGVWLERSAQVARRGLASRRNARGLDHFSGAAGGIVSLLALDRVLHDCRLVDLAEQLTRELGTERLAHAPGMRSGQNWSGPAKGVSGRAIALLELFRVTGNKRYRTAAEATLAALAYESPGSPVPDGGLSTIAQCHARKWSSTVPHGWCDGSAGVALALLRAHRVLGDEPWTASAGVAIDMTRAQLAASLHARRDNYSLCHGLAGTADALISASHGTQSPTTHSLISQASATMQDADTRDLARWAPGLMLGFAGTGYLQLRLHDPMIPSVLAIDPEIFAVAGVT